MPPLSPHHRGACGSPSSARCSPPPWGTGTPTPRRMRIVILGLSIPSSWGNGHAATYRSLMRALCRRGHDVLFLECDKPWYREHRDLDRLPFGTVRLYDDIAALRRRCHRELAEADLV